MVKFTAQHNPTGIQANLFAHVAGDQFIVACQDLDLYAITFQRLQHLGRVRLSAKFLKCGNKRVGDSDDDPWQGVPRPRVWLAD